MYIGNSRIFAVYLKLLLQTLVVHVDNKSADLFPAPDYPVMLYNTGQDMYKKVKQPRVDKIMHLGAFGQLLKVHGNLLEQDVVAEGLEVKGRHFRVAYQEHLPHFYAVKDNRACGYEAILLRTIASKLNFSYSLVKGDIVDIVEGKCDVVIGATSLTYERYKKVAFTSVFFTDSFALMYLCRTTFWEAALVLTYPFRWQVWLVLGIYFAMASTLIRSLLDDKKVWLKLLVEQPVGALRATNLRPHLVLLCGVLLLSTTMFTACFKSKLTSFFAKRPHHEPSSLEELIHGDFEIIASDWAVAFFSDLFAKDGELMYLHDKLLKYPNDCTQVEHIISHRAAMMYSYTNLQYSWKLRCQKELFETNDSPDKLRLTSATILNDPHAWMVRPDSTIWKPFSEVIDRLLCSGLITKWIHDTNSDINIYMEIPYAKNNFPEEDGINFQPYCFLVYFAGNALALVGFCAEVAYTRCRRCKLY